MMDIRRSDPEDAGAIKTLLAVCLLPLHDFPGATTRYVVAESERGIIGVGGLDLCAPGVALVRSVAVMPGYRKQQIGRRLVARLEAAATEENVGRIYLLTETAGDYFGNMGFVHVPRDEAPAVLKESPLFGRLATRGARLMMRASRHDDDAVVSAAVLAVSEAAKRHFDSGYFCAESVLLSVAKQAGITSPIVPAIATGFCNGIARTWGTCGALSGGIMAVNLAYGRQSPDDPVAQNFIAVRRMIDEFGKACGATQCSELMACDLDTTDGRKAYREQRVKGQCRELVGVAARIAATLVQKRIDLTGADRHAEAA